jgi:hypothetical protein
MTIEKLSHFVEYPSVLDLSDYGTAANAPYHCGSAVSVLAQAQQRSSTLQEESLESPTKRARRENRNRGFHRLIAVVNHLGDSVMNGHYIAHVNTGPG